MSSPLLYSVESLSADDFDALLETLPKDLYIPFEQTGFWTVMHGMENHRTQYGFFVIRDGEEIIATVALDHFIRPSRESIVTLMGPVFVAERTAETERRVIDSLMDWIRKDPAVNPLYLRLQIEHPTAIPGAVPSIERGIFEREVVVPLENTPEDLKKTYSSTTRNLINRARRVGVEVREITEDRAEYFGRVCFPIMEETAERDGFATQPVAFYQRILESFPDRVRLYVAYAPIDPDADPRTAEKEPVAWMMSNEFHYRGCYYLAGSSKKAHKVGAMPALLNVLMTNLRATGNTAVGLTGIGSERWPELHRLERFKLSFSKNVVEYPSLYDVPFNRPRYTVLRTALIARYEAKPTLRRAAAKARSLAEAVKARGTRSSS